MTPTAFARPPSVSSVTRRHGRAASAGSRLFIVSNRLPFTAVSRDAEVGLVRSTGGLASALREVHERSDAIWVGWAGWASDRSDADRERIEQELLRHRAVPVDMSEPEIEGYYRRYANGVLWPTLHDMQLPADSDSMGWDLYRAMNERFADVIAPRLAPGDRVWVHDYHLMLLPALLRARVPRARIGFFLHTPVPSPARLTALAEWEALADGLSGAEVIGVHTGDYAYNLDQALRRPRRRATHRRGAGAGGRVPRVLVHPIGTDAEQFSALGDDPEVLAEATRIRACAAGPLFVGVDRLDYTKGVPERLLAFERLLAEMPELCGRARLIQVGVPTREDSSGYGPLRDQVGELVARINREYGTATWAPIEYTFGSVDPARLVALYRAADVMLVTPLCDGMNLVAKEFVATRTDGEGVLVLSARAGAAVELWAALLVEPGSLDSLVASYKRALAVSPSERHVRMRKLRATVAGNDVLNWANRSLAALGAPRLAAGQ